MSTSTYYRVEALQKFEDVRLRAQICQISMRLANRPVNLLPFAPIRGRLSAINGVPRGVQEISFYVTEYPVPMRFDTRASLASILAHLEQLAVADLASVARS